MHIMKPKLLMFSPSDKSDNRSMSPGKDKMRMRKLLEKEHELGTRSLILSWNGTFSAKLELEMNPTSGLTYDQKIADDFISDVEAKRNAAAVVTV
jgi:hypothetical protein